jgi:hypothetical protein
MTSEFSSELSEVACEVCSLRLLGLSITGPSKIAEIDVASGEVGSWVDSRIGNVGRTLVGDGSRTLVRDWSRTLIGSGHLVMRTGEIEDLIPWDCKTHISSS